ncbi:type II toxin-antitoxin system Phd/YefM family antitoxin [Mycolicibacterium sp. F2034L]|uniref:type II toxin-antitoxin system Phd/YefM family antitoxin n=1 Tax=Mycolicibacterium sp. F2034L TaxID=2926422 RepID=UPI001FF2F8F4|nr:type II toxin-antitoxin system prevent-host-death family antitoxin [Mycolicibacterium sp. F2034L]MCK0177608.1 type II toxin-antitoxin system prevent-host-death family antitoxin [Mycolicibacterium sp. F2034L]
MVRMIPQRELRIKDAKLIDAVTAGETVVVTRNGEPVAELRPVRRTRTTFISRDELRRLAGTPLRISPREFRRDLDSVDQGL